MRFFDKPSAESARQHPGFTLIEILITVAITGIITTIIFVGLRNEQQRSASKDAADRLQVELVGLQNKIQSAIALPSKYCTRGGGTFALQGKSCTVDANCETSPGNPNNVKGRCISGPPAGYGMSFTAGSYTLFGDMPWGLTPPESVFRSGTYDVFVENKSYGTNLVLHRTFADGSEIIFNNLSVTFSGTDGKMIICKLRTGGCAAYATTARIVLRHTQTNTCYAINLSAITGIVSKRQFSPSCN